MSKHPARSWTRQRLLPLLTLRLAAIALLGCESTTSVEPQPAPAPTPVEAADTVAGWHCTSIESCMGLTVGRSRTFERLVGTRSAQEAWTLLDRQEVDGVVRFVQEGGPGTYELRGNSLWMPLRGELVEVMRFPVRDGDAFTIDRESGGRIAMTVRAVPEPTTTPAGTYARCLRHEARFENNEFTARSRGQAAAASAPEGLAVETTFCEGVGEVRQRIRLPEMPHPVEFALVATGEGA